MALTNETKIFKGLVDALNENLQLQRQYPENDVTTIPEYPEEGVDEPAIETINNKRFKDNLIVSMLLSTSGDEVTSSIHTNVYHLVVLFQLDDEELKTLDSLAIAAEFSHLEEDGKNIVYADCSDDVERAASLFSEIMQAVVGIPYEAVTSFMTTVVNITTKENEQKRLMKLANKQFVSLKAYYKLPNDDKQLERIVTKVEKFNKRADKYGYQRFNLDKQALTLSGSYIPREETADMSYWAKVCLAGRNGDLQGDFNGVCKMFKS